MRQSRCQVRLQQAYMFEMTYVARVVQRDDDLVPLGSRRAVLDYLHTATGAHFAAE